jgi:hypothetical protein
VSSVRYELGFYIPEDSIPHSHRCEDLKSYEVSPVCVNCLTENNGTSVGASGSPLHLFPSNRTKRGSEQCDNFTTSSSNCDFSWQEPDVLSMSRIMSNVSAVRINSSDGPPFLCTKSAPSHSTPLRNDPLFRAV